MSISLLFIGRINGYCTVHLMILEVHLYDTAGNYFWSIVSPDPSWKLELVLHRDVELWEICGKKSNSFIP